MANARKFANIVSILSLAAVVMRVVAQQPATAASAREADAVCARCHEDLYDSYMKTVMANASGALAVLKRMIEFDPDSIEIRPRLSEAESCRKSP
jgi:hypothetical protein